MMYAKWKCICGIFLEEHFFLQQRFHHSTQIHLTLHRYTQLFPQRSAATTEGNVCFCLAPTHNPSSLLRELYPIFIYSILLAFFDFLGYLSPRLHLPIIFLIHSCSKGVNQINWEFLWYATKASPQHPLFFTKTGKNGHSFLVPEASKPSPPQFRYISTTL